MENSTILIADDDQFQGHLLKKQCTKLGGKEILLAENGTQALKLYKQRMNAIKMIFCDLNMPDKDGIEFIRVLSEYNEKPHLVLISSEKDDVLASVQTMAYRYGFTNIDTLTKPISIQSLRVIKNKLVKQKISKTYQQNDIDITKGDILYAISHNEFELNYQPQIDSQTKEVHSAEALIRWKHHKHGLIMPDNFIPQVEQFGLMSSLTKEVIKQAITECKKWREDGLKVSISVNVTPSDLADYSLVGSIIEQLKLHNLSANSLTLEVTESTISENMAKTLDSMARLRINGVNLAIDDFGTGHSSLMQLIEAPFTELKIDKSFIDKIHNDRKSLAAIKASISLSKIIGLKTVAEGVETQEQADLLTKMGCDYLQGYFYSKPLSSENFKVFMANDYQFTRSNYKL